MAEIRKLPTRDESVDLSGVTELRVHGVGGTTPEQMLQDPHPRQVAGDRIAGFYRRSPTHYAPSATEAREVEAYSWGGLTSGSAKRALWLLLLPFTLANLAGWMHRRAQPGAGEPIWFRSVMRLICLSLTLTSALWVYSIAVDLVAYQCGAQPDCVEAHWWLRPLQHPFFADYPMRRLLLGAAVPLATVGLLAYLSRATRKRYEEVALEEDKRAAGQSPDLERPRREGLTSPAFWYGDEVVLRLARLHIAAALAGITGALAQSGAALDPSWEEWGGALTVAAAGVVGITAFGVCVPSRFPPGVIRILSAASGIALIVTAAQMVERPTIGAAAVPGLLPGLPSVAVTFFGVQLILLLCLAALLAWDARGARLRASDPDKVKVFRYGGPLIAATLATLSLDAALAGTAVRVADLHGYPVPAGLDEAAAPLPQITYPQVYDAFAASFASALLVVILVGACMWFGWKLRQDALIEEIQGEYHDDPSPSASGEPSWQAAIARWRYRSKLVDGADVVLTAMVGIALVFASIDLIRRLFADSITEPLILPRGSINWVWTTSTWIMSFIPLAAVVVLRYAYRNPELRRKVGILWDVGTFWPRAYHPLAPPSYAERAVPDLRRRITRLIEEGNGCVVLSAHSQGTVLAAAALAQLSDGIRRRVALVTYGCPLSRLYGRAFPAYFGREALADLRAGLAAPLSSSTSRWRNFYRLTDLIGGPVFSKNNGIDDTDDVLLRDPPKSQYTVGEPWPAVAGHSGYLEDETMTRFLDQITAELAAQIPQRGGARPSL